MKIRKYPKGVSEYADQHGKLRVRGRRKGSATYYFKSEPGTSDFEAELRAWLLGCTLRPKIGVARTRPGSVSDVIVRWYQSGAYVGYRRSTKATFRGIAERFRIEHGDKQIADLEQHHVRRLIASKASTPAAANNLLKVLRLLIRVAIDDGLRKDDPTIGVRPLRNQSSGFHTWDEQEIAQFEAAHPIGTRARLALALLLYTAQRRSDVVRMGKQHIRNDRIYVRQQKTGTSLAIPIHPMLCDVLAKTPTDNMTFLVTRGGKPFTPAGFTNWFRDCCRLAGLPLHCSSHGLRKAAARRLAEDGKSANVIAAVTGHKSLREVERYTAAADQSRLADQAFGNKTGMESEQKLANQDDRLAKSV